MSEEPTPQELLDSLENDLRSLQDDASLSSYKSRLAEISSSIESLPSRIEAVRTRGYRYKSYLEGKAKIVSEKWAAVEGTAKRTVHKYENELKPPYDAVAARIIQLRRAGNSVKLRGEINAVTSEIEQFKGRVSAAHSAIDATFGSVESALSQTESQLGEVIWLLDELDQASFSLHAEENPIQAVSAKWWRDGKNKGPEGVLYLTDQRLIFEQKEKVATKKVLFIATEKELVQEMLLESPIASLESAQASSKGIFGAQDHIDFNFGAGDYPVSHFHLKGQDSEFWAALVKRVRSGEIQTERYYAEGEAQAGIQSAEEALADAPEKCSTCGAPFSEPIAKGQRQIQCEYCGNSMHW